MLFWIYTYFTLKSFFNVLCTFSYSFCDEQFLQFASSVPTVLNALPFSFFSSNAPSLDLSDVRSIQLFTIFAQAKLLSRRNR